MSNKKNIFRSIIGVTTSNIATIIAGIIIGFIIPKVLPVEGFGYYKSFTLYVTYAGFFSIGIIDGIVLDYGGIDYSEYDKRFFRSVFRWYIIIHLIWALAIVTISILFKDRNYSFLIFMIAIYMFFANTVGYFQQISQITQRFKEYSKAKVIQSVMKITGGLVMVGLYFISTKLADYRIYIVLSTLGFVIVAIGYTIIYRDIVFGESNPLKETKSSIFHFSKIGFPLMFANLCGTLILTLDRQFVNLLFPNKEYAIYAFAYNLLSLITVATSAISTVLYPLLKRTTDDSLKKNYSILISIILSFVYGAIISYFPLCAFIRWFLPKYIDSLNIFRVIFPGLAISSAVTVVMHNYYKTLGRNIIYFKKSVIVLILSALANGVAYIAFKNTISISIASIITMIIWYLYIEQFFVTKYGYSRIKNMSYLLVMMIAFYVVTSIPNWILSGIIYIVAYSLITFLFQHSAIKSFKQIMGSK